MKVMLRNKYYGEKDIKKQLKKKNIKYDETPNFIFIDNVKEVRHFRETIDLVIDNYTITIETYYVSDMVIK